MKVIHTTIHDVLVIEPQVFTDARGFFYKSFNQEAFNQATGLNETFVQDNISRSAHNVLRGLYCQLQNPQGKLVQIVAGEVFDVAVDLRKSSASFGHWVGTTLSSTNRLQQWIPPGFAHGFLVTSACADMLYETNCYYTSPDDRVIMWNDAALGIEWPVVGVPLLSTKDALGNSFASSDVFYTYF